MRLNNESANHPSKNHSSNSKSDIAAKSSKSIELADIFKKHGCKLTKIHPDQEKVIQAILNCRTSKLGAHILKCNECSHEEISYNSCRNRHCPKCQSLAAFNWVEKRKSELLPVQYFHIVFTFSDALYPLALRNKKTVYNILFKAVSETIKESAANPDNLGVDVGFISILHTWKQDLNYHPHMHCIVPAGGLTDSRQMWKNSKNNFFIHVLILSKVFRGKFLHYLEKAYNKGELKFPDKISEYSEHKKFKELLKKSCKNDWVVYSKKPFAGPEQVLNYLGRYTHRVAISNSRILSVDENYVFFKWKDRKDDNKVKVMKLDVVLFMKRFLLHLLPYNFMRIRHYGILSNSCKKKLIALCRSLLNISDIELPEVISWRDYLFNLTGVDITICSVCGYGKMISFKNISPEVKVYRH